MRSIPTTTVPADATVVVTDGSGHGAGIVAGGHAFALPWQAPRPPELQQRCEWEAAALGVDHAIRHTDPGRAILLVADNLGLLAGMVSGNPAAPHATNIVRSLHKALKGPLWCAFVPSEANPADAPSRAVAGNRPTTWPHPLEPSWRRHALLATWTVAEDDAQTT